MLHAEPKILIVETTFGGVPSLCAVAHAPHRGHPSQSISSWWTRFQSLLPSFYRQQRLILCMDANAGIGEYEPYSGPHYAQEVDTAGCQLLSLLQSFDLCAPSTFEAIHPGPSETWHSAKAHTSGNRNDYIWLSRTLLQQCVMSYVAPDLDAGNQALDHFAVVTIVDWPSSLHRPPKPRVEWDRSKLQHADATTWQTFFDDWPDIPWTTHPTTHMSIVEEHLHNRLSRFFPKDQGHWRNSCLDEEALDAMSQKLQLKKTLTTAKKQCDNHRLHVAILCWKCQYPYGIQLKQILCVLRTTWRWQRYGVLTRHIKQLVLQQRAQWLDRQIAPLQHLDRKSALSALKPLRMGKRVKD